MHWLTKSLFLIFLFTFTTVYAAHRRMGYDVYVQIRDSENRPVRNKTFIFSSTNQRAYKVSTDSNGSFEMEVTFILPCNSGSEWSLETIISQCEGYNGQVYRLYSEDKMALLPNNNYKKIRIEPNLSIPNDTLFFKLRNIDANGRDKYLSLLDKL